MSDFTERHYSVDPGEGQKMDGCPYSLFEDGHDVKDYIIPPKGYTFKSFKFETLSNNQIYDGRLVAQFEKKPLKNIIASNLWTIIAIAGGICVIGLIIGLAVGISGKPKSEKPKVEKTKNTKSNETPIVLSDTTTVDSTVYVTDTIADSIHNSAEGVILDLTDKVAIPEEAQEPVVQVDPNAAFKEEFWTLIHDGTIQMDPYDELYKKYKKDASGDEFEYLRLTILKDWATFKDWYGRLRKIPANERQSIETVNQLIQKLDAVE